METTETPAAALVEDAASLMNTYFDRFKSAQLGCGWGSWIGFKEFKAQLKTIFADREIKIKRGRRNVPVVAYFMDRLKGFCADYIEVISR